MESSSAHEGRSEINRRWLFNISNIGNLQIHSNSAIEKDVQSLLKPFNIMFALFICSKYKIQDGLISANSMLYYVISTIGSSV
ncbi:hypothetical protein B5X24_HaOG203730 [Helicoverpa armigera]|uniref:Uncharacterized protein n=1 Tax=Helicoverpa armigera TaxID=29058 RepID=A0A2W1BZ91_HELAM|nr:hypothetical protein B5X24_HaOG203730 [Helicoverpa armigera]